MDFRYNKFVDTKQFKVDSSKLVIRYYQQTKLYLANLLTNHTNQPTN
jgi:hypothetical protein